MRIPPKDILLVSTQFLLFSIYMLDLDWSLGVSHLIKMMGLIISILGLVVIILSILQLNKNLTPFPTPKDNSVLIENGMYKLVRHPIYSGLILLFVGYGVYQNSLYKVIITFLLLLLFHFKTKYEEQQLQNKFSQYNLYKSKTGKFFPKFNLLFKQ
jgi:protein-S-isoprenylcysteine O-methyltransferase Ste14